MPSATLFSIAVHATSDVEMPAGIEDRNEYLVAPDASGGWSVAHWDGARWYDSASGELLEPCFVAALPAV